MSKDDGRSDDKNFRTFYNNISDYTNQPQRQEGKQKHQESASEEQANPNSEQQKLLVQIAGGLAFLSIIAYLITRDVGIVVAGDAPLLAIIAGYFTIKGIH